MRTIIVRTLFCGLALVWLGHAAACGEVLITADEAKLPASSNASLPTRGMTRGPVVEQESPPANQSVASPLAFKIKFETRNHVDIDPASIKLVYIKAVLVDLTARIRKYLKPDGIIMDQAEVPPGVHLLRLDLKDLQGRVATAVIKLSVADK